MKTSEHGEPRGMPGNVFRRLDRRRYSAALRNYIVRRNAFSACVAARQVERKVKKKYFTLNK